MSRVIGGWAVSLEAGVDPASAVYDDPVGGYDRELLYDADGEPGWWPVDCQLTGFTCDRGASASRSPGVTADAGGLQADLYDPDRLLDATGPRGTLLSPGVPVRVVARKGAGEAVLWSGTADSWPHDMLTGEGSLNASDVVSHLAAVPVTDLVRPAESTPDRLAALLAVAPAPPPFTATGTGRATLCPATLSGDLWQCMKAVIDTDQSWLWVGTDGTVRWQGRDAVRVADLTVVDCPDDGPWDGVYVRLPTDSDDSRLVNIVSARRIQPSTVTDPPAPYVVSRADSVAVHDPQQLENVAVQLGSDVEVEQWAEDTLTMLAYPVPGPTRIVLAVDDSLPWANQTMDTIIGLDIGSVLRIRLTTRGPAQEWVAVVAALEHEADPHSLTTTVRFGRVTEVGVHGYDASDSRYDSTTFDHPADVHLRSLMPV